MGKDKKTPEKNSAGVELKFSPTDYLTWGCPIFVLEASL